MQWYTNYLYYRIYVWYIAQYSAEGATSCTDCPVGHSCPTPDATPIQCDPGQYSAAGGRLDLNVRIIWTSLLMIFRDRFISEDFLIFKTIQFDFTKACVNLVHFLLGKKYILVTCIMQYSKTHIKGSWLQWSMHITGRYKEVMFPHPSNIKKVSYKEILTLQNPRIFVIYR